MINRIRIVPYLFVIGALFLAPFSTISAQEAVTLSVTPPFFQLTVAPGETWSSSIKVVNVNDFPLTAFTSVVNFESVGEGGKGKFSPLLSDTPEYREQSLAGWVAVLSEQVQVSPGQSVKVPFSITVPENAPPGGHYAAILIGNQPIAEEQSGPQLAVSTLISTLIFVRVAGDVVEDGTIREFVSEEHFYRKPDVSLSLRFENQGNVHLLPQGDITIFNMWGKERGKILINQKTEFGNVLPNSIRKYDYRWTGNTDSFEIGRYKAIATLGYGGEAKQHAIRETSFWVIPVIPVMTTLSIVIAVILVISWFIRRYIRKALGDTGYSNKASKTRTKALAQPIVDGVMDLRSVRKQGSNEERMSVLAFISRYRMFFYFILVLIFLVIGLYFYLDRVLLSDHSFEIQEIESVDSSEPIFFEES